MIDNSGSSGFVRAGADGGLERRRTQLFTLRLWVEDIDDERHEWRGELQHVNSQELRYFREWSALIGIIVAMLPDIEKEQCQE
jgi:hypothetical protein